MNLKRYIKNIVYITTVFLLFSTFQCYADTDIENEDLARIVRMLNSLTPLINEAEHQSDPNNRVSFNYDELRLDLNKIKQGIQRKWDPNLTLQPRVINSISGDYIVFRNKQR